MYRPAVATGSIPSPELIRPQLARILASPAFQAHPRASAFLRYVVEQALAGRAGEIKQATIGCEVFGRPASYDPRQDAVVRSVARALREKLNGYYLADGAADPVRIEIPKGSYVPLFRATPNVPEMPPWHVAWPVAVAACLLLCALGRDAKAPDAPALYLAGRQKLLAGDIVAARPLLEIAASLAPRDALMHSNLANDLMALGYNALALEEAFKAVATAGGLSPTDALEVEGVLRAASGDYQAAAAAYTQLVERRPARIDYRRALAQTQLAAGLPAECLRTIAQAPASAADDAQLAIAEAYCRAGSGDFLGALEPVRRAAAVSSERGEHLNFAHARLVEAGLLMSTNRTIESAAARNQARQICTTLGDDLCAIRALRIQANTDVWEMRSTAALAAYRAALPLARRMGSIKETGELLDGEGYALMQTDDFAGANAAFLEALLTAQRGG
jgi:tetratricopeptide (TPR) repeat protein